MPTRCNVLVLLFCSDVTWNNRCSQDFPKSVSLLAFFRSPKLQNLGRSLLMVLYDPPVLLGLHFCKDDALLVPYDQTPLGRK